MENLNPDEHNNVINPYRLSAVEVEEIMTAVNDERLENPPGDYFRLKLENKMIDIPKLKYVSRETETGKITRLPTTEYIRQRLAAADSS